jgi:hypothetical protein
MVSSSSVIALMAPAHVLTGTRPSLLPTCRMVPLSPLWRSLVARRRATLPMQAQTTTLRVGGTLPAMILADLCMSSFIYLIAMDRRLKPRRPVYEYPLNGQWIMMDADDGYILWTGIWKGVRRHLIRTTLNLTNFYK